MGYMSHNAIVVTSWQDKAIEAAHAEARRLFSVVGDSILPSDADPACYVTNITETAVNGYRSFLVAPDGSKEGWSHSDWGEEQREKFIRYLVAGRYEDGSGRCDWVEVQYGNDDHRTEIVRDSDNYFPEDELAAQ
jgi:hypothetical protein